MQAMIMHHPKHPLELTELPNPSPQANEVLVKVHACGICRTDLHIIDHELTRPKLPLIPGHQIVGIIEQLGNHVTHLKIGQRVGIPWLGSSCQQCHYCQQQQENLCDQAKFTGYQINGGFAEYCTANSQFCFPLPDNYSDIHAAPLLCAGLIGYRALRKTGDGKHLGIYGFGAAAHIIVQVAICQGKNIYAFTRPGDNKTQAFAKQLGATWAGNADVQPPQQLDAAIIFAPIGELVPAALKQVTKGGVVVCAGIHMSDIPSFPYETLWGERTLCSVANLTRHDGEEFLKLAAKHNIHTEVTTYSLSQVNQALDDLRYGRFNGAGVIIIN